MSDRLSEEGRKNIQEANRYRNLKCGNCGTIGTEIVDGEKIGGMPGLKYRHCGGCGWSRAITKRMTKREMLEGFNK